MITLARTTGWIALSLLAISFCTPIRSPKLNTLIGGYRFQLKIHHWVGVAAIAFMSMHLAILVVDYSSSLRQLLDLSDQSIVSGWIAFICSAIVVTVAFRFRSAPYRRWRRVHLVFIFGFLAGVLHSFLVLEPRTILEWLPLVLAALIGGLGIVWSLWLPQLPTFGVPYVIARQRVLRPDLIIQGLAPADPRQSLRFAAGQFVFLRYGDPQFSTMWHPFTVVGFSDSGEFELLIKSRGLDTNLLHKVVLPSSVRINGPFGDKFWGSDEPQMWIAYGVGIAIFLAAARTMPDDIRSIVHLVYCEKSRERIVFDDEFDALSARKKHFSWGQDYGEGPDVVEHFKREVATWSTTYRLFRICGHPGFQTAVKDLLIDAGVASHAIILEGVF